MKNIYYESSEGEIVNLISPPYMMMTDTELLNSSWEWETVGSNFPRIAKLKKVLVSPKFSVKITGSTDEDMATNLENLISVFDRDCFLEKMGRLYIGDFYRDCYITSNTKGKVFKKNNTIVEFVATSDDSLWKNDKEITMSGPSALMGEIASTVFVDALKNEENIVFEPKDDGTVHLEYTTTYSAVDNWLKFDMGKVIDIDSFSGLKLNGSVTPVAADIQISSGETEDDARSISAVTVTETDRIYPNDFTTITIDDYGDPTWDGQSLWIQGYVNYEKVSTTQLDIGTTMDVSDFDFFTFMVRYVGENNTTVDYTVNLEQWETVQQISINAGSSDSEEIVVENETFRYLRIIGNYFGAINDDLSILSGELVPPRNLLDLGFSMTNLENFKRYTPSETAHFISFDLADPRQDGYITSDNQSLVLKKIRCEAVQQGAITIQGYTNNAWVDIVSLDTESPLYEQTYDTHYDMIRVRANAIPSSLVEYVIVVRDLSIECQTDSMITNDSYAPSEAVISIKGIPNNPSIVIGDNTYGANIELAEGHKLVIDTKEKTVRDYANDTSYENVFNERTDGALNPIESGDQMVEWNGSVEELKITLEQARSEPKWN